jgi:hypothetical protein
MQAYIGLSPIHADVFFFHPDFTVGSGVSPNQPREALLAFSRVADFTASRESHPTLKNFLLFI